MQTSNTTQDPAINQLKTDLINFLKSHPYFSTQDTSITTEHHGSTHFTINAHTVNGDYERTELTLKTIS